MAANEQTKNSGVLRIAAFSALLWAGLFLHSTWCLNFDFSWFVQIGEKNTAPDTLPGHLAVIRNSDGYDGQFYYRLALDPFTSEKSAHGIVLDDPPLRQQRILYPLLVWILSAGGRLFVPETMMLVNLACLVFLGWIGARIATATGREPAFGLLFSLFPGFVFSLRFDLTEPLAAAMLTTYLFCYIRKKPVAANAALAMAILARETMAIVAAGKILELLYRFIIKRENIKKELLLSLVPFVPFLVLQAVLYLTWGRIPLLQSSTENITAPFTGMIRYFHWLLFHSRDVRSVVDFMHPAGILIFTATALRSIIKNRFSPPSHTIWLLSYAVILFSLGSAWNITFLRVFTDYFILCSFVILSSKPRHTERILLYFAFLWFMLSANDAAIIDFYMKTYFNWK